MKRFASVLALAAAGCAMKPLVEAPRAVPSAPRIEVLPVDASVACFRRIAQEKRIPTITVELRLAGYAAPTGAIPTPLEGDRLFTAEQALVPFDPYIIMLPPDESGRTVAGNVLIVGIEAASRNLTSSSRGRGLDVMFGGGNGEGDASIDGKTEVSTDGITVGGRILTSNNMRMVSNGYASVSSVMDRTTAVVDHSVSVGGVGAGRTLVLRTAPGVDSVLRDTWRVLYLALLARVHGIDLAECIESPPAMNPADVAGLGRARHPANLRQAIALVLSANRRIVDPNRIRVGDVIYLPATELQAAKTVRVARGMSLSAIAQEAYLTEPIILDFSR